MRFLADDLLEGRATGTRGHEIAAKLMASEFEAMGLEPAGENGAYFQSVPLRSMRPDREYTMLSTAGAGRFVLGARPGVPSSTDPTTAPKDLHPEAA